jgi:hypothetical protein
VRFILFDRVLELDRGRRIVGVTTFGRGSPPSDDQVRFTVPASLLIEAMVQLLGWAVIHAHDFSLAAIVCLVEQAVVHEGPPPGGVPVTIGGEILSGGRDDTLGRAWADVGGVRRATIDRVIYRHFHDVDGAALEREFATRLGAGSRHLGETPTERP